MDSLLIFASGLIAGIAIGAWGVWQLWLRHERVTVNATLVVTPEVLRQVNAAVTLKWLDAQGLTWTAKGAEFNHDRVQR